MALLAAHGQSAVQGTTPAVLYSIAQLLAAGGFSNQAQVDLFTRFDQVFDNLDGAVDRWAFLIAGNQEAD